MDGRVRIVGALVNPFGDDVGQESVTLVNASPQPIDLNGWMIADKNKHKEVLVGPILEAGAAISITLSGVGAQLSNKGGIISLLDEKGLKVDGVSYTREDASKDGWTLVF